MEMENQCRLLEDNAKFLKIVSQFMSQRSGHHNPNDIPNAIQALKEKQADLDNKINQQMAGTSMERIQVVHAWWYNF